MLLSAWCVVLHRVLQLVILRLRSRSSQQVAYEPRPGRGVFTIRVGFVAYVGRFVERMPDDVLDGNTTC